MTSAVLWLAGVALIAWRSPGLVRERTRPGPGALDFYQASCPPCRVLEPRQERVAAQYAGRLPAFRIDVDRGLPSAKRFGMMSILTVLVFRMARRSNASTGAFAKRI